MGPLRTLVFFAVLLAGCTCGCGAVQLQDSPPGLSLVEQQAVSVGIRACGRTGSGVLVSPNRVLTATHVVKGCDTLIVETTDKIDHVAELEIVYRRDIARLALKYPVAYAPRLSLADPVPGSGVCFTAASPERSIECGDVRGVGWHDWRGEIGINNHVAKGNSGAPLWNGEGKIIGLIVTCDTLDGTNICLPFGGGATSFEGVEWLVEDVNVR